jgi:tRNA threonylcarbamoyladenosine biosynthesis protein TsaE
MEYISKTVKDTHNIAEEVLNVLMSKKNEKALIIVLKGNLGAGKTEFVKGLKSFFKIKNNILSPTFVLMKVYDILNTKIRFKKLYHFDLYRMIDKKLKQKELEESLNYLDIYDVLNNSSNIVLIE